MSTKVDKKAAKLSKNFKNERERPVAKVKHSDKVLSAGDQHYFLVRMYPDEATADASEHMENQEIGFTNDELASLTAKRPDGSDIPIPFFHGYASMDGGEEVISYGRVLNAFQGADKAAYGVCVLDRDVSETHGAERNEIVDQIRRGIIKYVSVTIGARVDPDNVIQQKFIQEMSLIPADEQPAHNKAEIIDPSQLGDELMEQLGMQVQKMTTADGAKLQAGRRQWEKTNALCRSVFADEAAEQQEPSELDLIVSACARATTSKSASSGASADGAKQKQGHIPEPNSGVEHTAPKEQVSQPPPSTQPTMSTADKTTPPAADAPPAQAPPAAAPPAQPAPVPSNNLSDGAARIFGEKLTETERKANEAEQARKAAEAKAAEQAEKMAELEKKLAAMEEANKKAQEQAEKNKPLLEAEEKRRMEEAMAKAKESAELYHANEIGKEHDRIKAEYEKKDVAEDKKAEAAEELKKALQAATDAYHAKIKMVKAGEKTMEQKFADAHMSENPEVRHLAELFSSCSQRYRNDLSARDQQIKELEQENDELADIGGDIANRFGKSETDAMDTEQTESKTIFSSNSASGPTGQTRGRRGRGPQAGTSTGSAGGNGIALFDFNAPFGQDARGQPLPMSKHNQDACTVVFSRNGRRAPPRKMNADVTWEQVFPNTETDKGGNKKVSAAELIPYRGDDEAFATTANTLRYVLGDHRCHDTGMGTFNLKGWTGSEYHNHDGELRRRPLNPAFESWDANTQRTYATRIATGDIGAMQ